ncbi:MAG: methylthioribulose 1-phosphate dehydratase [Planctomycetales bacterium]|nr:methylthioribulose 1-phosphate dehydratase [Planctomycetales bacterium]
MSHTSATSPLVGLEGPIDALRECGAMLWQRGWSVGTSSNYSVVLSHDPLELLVTASGMDKGRLGRGDFVRVGADGRPTVDGQPKSSAETMLHVVLAQQPGVGAVLHTHSVWATLLGDYFGDDGGMEIAGYEMLKGLDGVRTHEHCEWVPIFENTQDIATLAREMQSRLFAEGSPAVHGFLIRKHGLYTWGADLEAARRHIEVFEFLFECVARKLQWNNQARSPRDSLAAHA